MDREDILKAIEDLFDNLANEFLNETQRYTTVENMQSEFTRLQNLLMEDFESMKSLEDFCSSYM